MLNDEIDLLQKISKKEFMIYLKDHSEELNRLLMKGENEERRFLRNNAALFLLGCKFLNTYGKDQFDDYIDVIKTKWVTIK
jgi:hypothetical protein